MLGAVISRFSSQILIKMEYLAKEIVEEFEKNYPIPTSVSEWENKAEEILLYLAAKKYLERYG